MVTRAELAGRTPQQQVSAREKIARTAEAQKIAEQQAQAEYEKELAAYNIQVAQQQATQRTQELKQAAYKKAFEHATVGGTLSGDYPPEFIEYYRKYREEMVAQGAQVIGGQIVTPVQASIMETYETPAEQKLFLKSIETPITTAELQKVYATETKPPEEVFVEGQKLTREAAAKYLKMGGEVSYTPEGIFVPPPKEPEMTYQLKDIPREVLTPPATIPTKAAEMTFKDVSWKQTFFPETQKEYYERTGQLKLPSTAQDWIETKWGQAGALVSGGVKKIREAGITPQIFGIKGITSEMEQTKFPIQITPALKFAFFSPYFASGTARRGQAKAKLKQVSKEDVEKAKRTIDIVRANLAERKAGEEQIRYLNELAKKVDKTNPEQVRIFRELVRKLYEEGTFKGIPMDFYATSPRVPRVSTWDIELLLPELSRMKQAGTIGAALTFFLPSKTTKIYEPTKEAAFLEQPQPSAEKPKVIGKIEVGLLLGGASVLQTVTAQETTQKLKQETILKPKQEIIQIQVTPQTQISPLAQQQIQIQKQKQIQQQIQQQVLSFKTPLRFRLPPPPPAIPISKGITGEAIKRVPTGKGAYELFVRKRGKWFPIGKFPTLGIAKVKGITKVSKTLRASFKITKAGKPIPLSLGAMFRPAKKEPGVYVEKRRFRLSTPTEVKEIQIARKMKGGRKLKWL